MITTPNKAGRVELKSRKYDNHYKVDVHNKPWVHTTGKVHQSVNC